jgi:DNA-binding NarL/FixJ family response regulator
VGSSLTPGGQLSYDAAETKARADLGDTVYGALWNEGHGFTLDEAMDQAIAAPCDDLEMRMLLPPASQLGRDGLSPREREVLMFLARGQTNQQIAEALFVSRRTISNHVASILAKLGVPTRAAAAAHAVRHGFC